MEAKAIPDFLKLISHISYLLSNQKPEKQDQFNWKFVSFDQQNTDTIRIFTKKGFGFNENCGHIWYKNLNIPTVKLTCINKNANRQPTFSKKCRIISLRQQIEDKKVVQVELKGKTEQHLKWGECEFSGIRFTSTSHSFKGARYFLVVILTEETIDEKGQHGEKLWGDIAISPSILVESRKKAHRERQTTLSYFSAFQPEKLDSNYKKDQKEESKDAPLVFNLKPSKSSIEQLFDYLSNPRIRQKIFHPLFLFFKFPNTVRLFYNHTMIQYDRNDQDNSEFFCQMQDKIQDILDHGKQRKQNQQILSEKLFLLCINSEENNMNGIDCEKIQRFLGFLDGPIVSVFCSVPNQVPKQFTELEYNDNLRHQYTHCYRSFFIYKMNTKNSKSPQNSDNVESESIGFNEPQYFHSIVIDLNPKDQEEKKKMQKIAVFRRDSAEKNDLVFTFDFCAKTQKLLDD